MTYSSILLALPFLALASALPTTDSADAALSALRGAFSINQVHSGQIFKSGPLAMRKTYLKYTNTVPQNIAVAAASDAAAAAAVQSGSVAANPESYDSAYLSPVSIGSNAQTLNLDFDTGSADLWVFSTFQPASQQTGHHVYNPANDATASLKSGYTWQISYGDGSGASGNKVYADQVAVGPVTATSQAVEAATSVSSSFVSDPADGLLGLAFGSINTVMPTKQTTFFETVMGSLPSKLFAVTLKKGKVGSYDFGFIDSTKYTGTLTYTPVDNSQGFWGFTAGAYAVGSTSYAGPIGSSIADTGTTLIYVPTAVVQNYYAQVSGAKNSATYGGYVFPCSSTLPNFKVVIGGATRTVPGSYIKYAPLTSTSTTCFGGIQSSSGIGINIFGDIFLKSQYAVFDYGNLRLGFAQQAGIPSS